MSSFGPGYTTTAAHRAERMKAKITALNSVLDAEKKSQVAVALQQLQQKQVDEINALFKSFDISEPVVTTIDDVTDLFRNFGLSSGGRKSRRRKSRKSMKSRRRRY